MRLNKRIFILLFFIFTIWFVFPNDEKVNYTSFKQMKIFDINNDNKISVDEFINYSLQEETKENYNSKKEKLLKIFKQYDKNFDKNKTNFITISDFELTHKRPIIEGLRLMIVGMLVVFVFLIIMVIIMNFIKISVKIINKISPEKEEVNIGNIKRTVDKYEDIAVALAVVKTFTIKK